MCKPREKGEHRKRPNRNSTDNLTSLHCPSKTALIQLLSIVLYSIAPDALVPHEILRLIKHSMLLSLLILRSPFLRSIRHPLFPARFTYEGNFPVFDHDKDEINTTTGPTTTGPTDDKK
jgi:hypothetical protein